MTEVYHPARGMGCRAELTVLERAEQLSRRKDIYEALHPETKHGATGGGRDGKGTRKRAEVADSATSVPEAFASDVAAKTGGGKKPKDGMIPSFVLDTASKAGVSASTVSDAQSADEARRRTRKDWGQEETERRGFRVFRHGPG